MNYANDNFHYLTNKSCQDELFMAAVLHIWLNFKFKYIFLGILNFVVDLNFPNIPGYRTFQRIQTALHVV